MSLTVLPVDPALVASKRLLDAAALGANAEISARWPGPLPGARQQQLRPRGHPGWGRCDFDDHVLRFTFSELL